MILQIDPAFKALFLYNKQKSFQDTYNEAVEKAFEAGSTLQMPYSGTVVRMGRSHPVINGREVKEPCVKNGNYKRGIIDAAIVKTRSGRYRYVFTAERCRVQLVLEESGHSHALLFNLIVPFEKFTLRAALALVHLYAESGETPEVFCDHLPRGVEITVACLKRLLAWLQENFPHLQISLLQKTCGGQESQLAGAVRKIQKDFSRYCSMAVNTLHKALFQWRTTAVSVHLTPLPIGRSALSK